VVVVIAVVAVVVVVVVVVVVTDIDYHLYRLEREQAKRESSRGKSQIAASRRVSTMKRLRDAPGLVSLAAPYPNLDPNPHPCYHTSPQVDDPTGRSASRKKKKCLLEALSSGALVGAGLAASWPPRVCNKIPNNALPGLY
jgi:hypothetical protein